MTMADFAKAQLMKYGWTEGKGLGKNENGITEAIRPNLKRDTAGIGHKDTDTNAWWECAFNKAAKSISVDSRRNGVTITSTCDTEQTDAPPNGTEAADERNGVKQYKNFLKTSTLCNGNMVNEAGFDSSKVKKEPEGTEHVPLTDEELFKACGGRTAHKGARHGLRLNGKLERIAQQEKELLSSNSRISACCIDALLTVKSKKANKLRTEIADEESEELYGDECETFSNAGSIISMPPYDLLKQLPKSKSARKKQRRRINNLMHQLTVSCNISESDKKLETSLSDTADKRKCLKRKRSKDRKTHTESNVNKDTLSGETENEVSEIPLLLSNETGKHKRKRQKGQKHAVSIEQSKKGKNQSTDDVGIDITQVDNEEELVLPTKMAKKLHKKVVDLAGKLNTVSLNEEETGKVKSRRSKRKDRKKVSEHKLKNKVSKREKSRQWSRHSGKLERITKSLMAVNFSTEGGKNSGVAKVEKKMDSIVKNLMAVNLTENVTASVTGNTKRKKKQRKQSKCKSENTDASESVM